MKETKVRITIGAGRTWTHSEGVHVCGHIIVGRRVLTGQAFTDWVREFEGNLPAALVEAAGEFAFVVEHRDGCSIAVDPIRSIPLYYGMDDTSTVVSNRAETVAEYLRCGVADDVDKLAFLLQGLCLNDATLAGGVRQVRAGDFVTIESGYVRPQRYVQPGQTDLPVERPLRLDQAVSTIELAFNRMLSTIDGPIAVPLSGGLDSRLVAAMLIRYGRTDSVCFSYGSRRSFDATVSRHVADRLGLPWEFVPYSSRRWREWASSSEFESYRRLASNLSAIEHEQDWPPVRVLIETHKIHAGTVVVPGHSGDFLAGSHLPTEAFKADQSTVLDWIWRRYYSLWPTDHVPGVLLTQLRERIESTLCESASDVLRFDDYGWRNRQATMIVNSVRAYEDHGLDWRLPLWDRGMIDFWLSLPASDRREKNLYRDAIRRLIGPLADVPASDPRSDLRQRLGAKLWDNGLYRYAIFAALRPGRSIRVIGDLVDDHDEVLQNVIAPVRRLPIRRVSINALLALLQLEDSLALIRGL